MQFSQKIGTKLQSWLESRNANEFSFTTLLKGRAHRVPSVSSTIILKMQSM